MPIKSRHRRDVAEAAMLISLTAETKSIGTGLGLAAARWRDQRDECADADDRERRRCLTKDLSLSRVDSHRWTILCVLMDRTRLWLQGGDSVVSRAVSSGLKSVLWLLESDL